MKILSRINLAYAIIGSLLANLFMDPKLYPNNDFTNVAIYLAVLGSLSSFFTGIIVSVSIHRYFNSLLIRGIKKFKDKNETYLYRKKAALSEPFNDILSYFWGNFFLIICILFMVMVYLFNLESFKIKLIPKSLSIEMSMLALILFFVFLISLSFDFHRSWREMNTRLEYFAYYEYYLQDEELREIGFEDKWIEAYESSIVSNRWTEVLRVYKKRLKEIYFKTRELKKFLKEIQGEGLNDTILEELEQSRKLLLLFKILGVETLLSTNQWEIVRYCYQEIPVKSSELKNRPFNSLTSDTRNNFSSKYLSFLEKKNDLLELLEDLNKNIKKSGGYSEDEPENIWRKIIEF